MYGEESFEDAHLLCTCYDLVFFATNVNSMGIPKVIYKGILSGYIKEKGINASCVIKGRLHITPNTKVGLDKHMMLHMN